MMMTYSEKVTKYAEEWAIKTPLAYSEALNIFHFLEHGCTSLDIDFDGAVKNCEQNVDMLKNVQQLLLHEVTKLTRTVTLENLHVIEYATPVVNKESNTKFYNFGRKPKNWRR